VYNFNVLKGKLSSKDAVAAIKNIIYCCVLPKTYNRPIVNFVGIGELNILTTQFCQYAHKNSDTDKK
jgi:hypothetical protein